MAELAPCGDLVRLDRVAADLGGEVAHERAAEQALELARGKVDAA